MSERLWLNLRGEPEEVVVIPADEWDAYGPIDPEPIGGQGLIEMYVPPGRYRLIREATDE